MGRGDAHTRSSLCREVGHLLGEMRVAQMLKNPPAMQEAQVRSLGQEDPQEKGMPVLLRGKSHGRGSLVLWEMMHFLNLITYEE